MGDPPWFHKFDKTALHVVKTALHVAFGGRQGPQWHCPRLRRAHHSTAVMIKNDSVLTQHFYRIEDG